MKRYILTGTPGSGKTSLIRALECDGYAVVEEAATGIIALEQTRGNPVPWKYPAFIDKIIALQKQRQMQTSALPFDLQFYDRSPVCTLALSRYLHHSPSDSLLAEVERIRSERVYEEQVFFVESLGFCEPTKARTISLEEAAIFEGIHRETYRSLGYTCISVAQGTVSERATVIKESVRTLMGSNDRQGSR